MKSHLTLTSILATVTLSLGSLVCSTSTLQAQKKRSLLDNDPDVIYLNDYVAKPIKFIVIEDAAAFASKKGNKSRKLATFKPGAELQLIAMTPNAYRVSGKGKHGKVSGWVSPKKLANKDPKFVENLKLLYERQILIKQLIANKEVAIGMSIAEVTKSLGEPTKKTSKVTKEGRTGSWEFITYEEKKHYNYFTDPVSGQVFKKLTHVTNEEKSNISIEFKNSVVTSVSMMEDNGPDKVKIINPPIIFGF